MLPSMSTETCTLLECRRSRVRTAFVTSMMDSSCSRLFLGNSCAPLRQSLGDFRAHCKRRRPEQLAYQPTGSCCSILIARVCWCRREMEAVVADQERLCVDAITALGSCSSPETCSRTWICGVASVAQLLESMEDIWSVHIYMEARMLCQFQL